MATANNKGWYANNDDDNDYYDYLVPIANESIYFSALDTCSMDEHMNDSTSSSSSSSSLNYYSSLSPKTMRRQRLLAEDDESAYTSLRPVNQYTAAEVNETQPKTSEKSDEQDSILAAYAQLEEFEKVGRRSLDYFRYSECLDRLEKTIFNSFENKVKSRKIKHYNIDQTIEETLEEADYENVLDELIKKMALQNSTSSTNSSSSSSSKISKRYINTDNKENVNISSDNSKKRRPLSIVNQNKESIVSSSSSSSSDDYSKSSYLSSCSSSSSLNYSTVKPVTIIERRYHNQERVESKNAAANIVKKREEKSKDEDLEILDECSSEFPLLEHAFNLVRRCNFGWDRFRRHELYSKFVGFVQQGSCTVIRSVASVFMSLMRLDFHELLKSFVSLPFKNRWNVLKNLIYYAVKLSLSAISNFFIDDGGEAFSRIVHSIYNYIANFTRLFLKFNR